VFLFDSCANMLFSMNTPIRFNNEGAHFRIADSELMALDTIAVEKYGEPVRELPIGKATAVLRNILLAGGVNGRLENEAGKTVVSSDMDGQEATVAAYAKVYDPYLGHAVLNIGRVSVDIIKVNEIDSPEAEPIFSFEILSNAYKWAKSVVEHHKSATYLHGDEIVSLPSGSLTDTPDRGELALEHQGLWLMRSGIGETQDGIVVRVPKT
jgi:hypothetical protein